MLSGLSPFPQNSSKRLQELAARFHILYFSIMSIKSHLPRFRKRPTTNIETLAEIGSDPYIDFSFRFSSGRAFER